MKTDRIVIRGPLRDVARTIGQLPRRNSLIRRSRPDLPDEGFIPSLADALHPRRQDLVVQELRRESPSTFTYRLAPARDDGLIAPFRPGRYLSVEVPVAEGPPIRRPFSICNSPTDARRRNAYEITVASGPGAFIADRIHRDWSVGTPVVASDPQGVFTYEPLRDPGMLVGIAGGSGVTPLRSIISEALEGDGDPEGDPASLILIQGARRAEELLFEDEFRRLETAYPERFRRICVLSEEPREGDGRGFIDAGIIADAMGDAEAALFICGPEGMHRHLDGQIPMLPRTPRRIRREDYGRSGAPSGRSALNIAVRRPGGPFQSIPADPGETVLVALERAGLNPPSSCRNGSCGWCRARLLDGSVRYEPEPTGLRAGDRERNHIHPCVALPEDDLVMEIMET